MEIRFIFDIKEPLDDLKELKAKYNFDNRNGLDFVMIGEHWSEIEEENRLLHQIERILNINLSLLDYWNPEVYDNELEINDLQKVLEDLKKQIEKNPAFFENINYGFNLNERYLKSQFLSDINFLIERIYMNKTIGAKRIKYETE